MVKFTRFIPWKKLQPLLIIAATLTATFLLLKLLGLQVVPTEDTYKSRRYGSNLIVKYFQASAPDNQDTVSGLRSNTSVHEAKSDTDFDSDIDPCNTSDAGFPKTTDWNAVCDSHNATFTSHAHRHGNVTSTSDLQDITDYALDGNGRYRIPEEFYEPEIKGLSNSKQGGNETLHGKGNKDGSHGNDKLHVILVPFSHADPGYGQTMEDTYQIYTRTILDLMVKKLSEFRNMTFQWSETVFLERWFRDIADDTKAEVRELISRGQLEIVLGGWVMPDEAVTHYPALIDQLIESHQWLKENLGITPTNAWMNDPFGYSGTMPYLLKESGIENAVVMRIHQAVKNTLMSRRSMDFLWRPYWNGGKGENDILYSVMPYERYSQTCGPDKKVCKMFDYLFMAAGKSYGTYVFDTNVHRLATQLHAGYTFTAKMFKYNTILMFIGEDNCFNNAQAWYDVYTNYDKLIHHINAVPEFNMHIKFGTIDEYFKRVREIESQHHKPREQSIVTESQDASAFPVISGDFFPYSDENNNYWTGFYSTRPWLKKLGRETEAMLRAADTFSTIAYHHSVVQGPVNTLFKSLQLDLREARRNVGLFQHHDAITGTSYPHVVKDFERRLIKSYSQSLAILKTSLASVLTGELTQGDFLHEAVSRLHARTIPDYEAFNVWAGGLDVCITNPLFKTRREIVSFAVTNKEVRLIDIVTSEILKTQISAMSQRRYKISLPVTLKPFEIRRFTLENIPFINEAKTTISTADHHIGNKIIELANSYISVLFDGITGSLLKICDKAASNQPCTDITSQFLQYSSKNSGAYVFNPAGKADAIPGLLWSPEIKVLRGDYYSEVDLNYGFGFRQVFRLYHITGPQGRGLHVRNTIQLQEDAGYDNVEVVMRLVTIINNGNQFYTDQNGFQLIGRKTYTTRPIESNYYPMATMAILEDNVTRLTLHSVQSHGVASLDNGWLEVMLDRVMEHDDGKGLGMGVKERVNTVTEFVIQIEHKPSTEAGTANVKETRFSQPSINAILVNEQFQDRIIIFSHQQPVHFLPNFSPYKHNTVNIPCDISITSLRNLVNNDLDVTGTGVTLHRKPMHCVFRSTEPSTDALPSVCSVGNSDNFLVRDLLKACGIDVNTAPQVAVYETNLTYLVRKRQLALCDTALPRKYELRSFLIVS